ncbi:MAG: DoxX family membrane protein [Patescibacteria group bacterium]|nr:DoxX family membrane protein [bacterium]MDZ4240837.1 DoxX family membrane protein [Patescibacteria group bacterium]
MQKFAPVVVRIGVSLVFLWFGFSQIGNPSTWFGFLPDWIPMSYQTIFIYINGGFEIVFGTLLLLGVFTRVAALLLALHLAGIVVTVGYSAIGVRDFGLTLATLSVFLHGPDAFTIDSRSRPS